MGLKPRRTNHGAREITTTLHREREKLTTSLLEKLQPTPTKGSSDLTVAALERKLGFPLGPENSALAATLRNRRINQALEIYPPEALSLSEILGTEPDFVVGYLSAFFSGATPFANMYHDQLFSVSWASGATGNQKVCVWNWDEGYGGHESVSVAAFLHERVLEGDDDEVPMLPSTATKETKLPLFLSAAKIWSRSHWLVCALYHSSYGEDWAYHHVAKPSDFKKEADHFCDWPHLVGHWLWWSLFFNDEAKLKTCLRAAQNHTHPFVCESAKLIEEYRKGKKKSFEKIVSLEQTQDKLRAKVPGNFPKAAKTARTKRRAQIKRQDANAHKVLVVYIKDSGDDSILTMLETLLADKTFDFMWVASVDYSVVRDAEDLEKEPYVQEHFSPETITQADYERVVSLRERVEPKHRPVLLQMVEALGNAKRHRPASGLVVELVARTCSSYDDMIKVLSGALKTPSTEMLAEITYAARLFPRSPKARKRLFDLAQAFTQACHGGKLPSSRGFTGLFQIDTKETAQLLAQFIDECAKYTLGDWPWRAVLASLKRVRNLEHGELCANACKTALTMHSGSYGSEQALMSLLKVAPKPGQHRKFLLKQYNEILTWSDPWSEYRPAQRGLCLVGALYFDPTNRVYVDEAEKIIRFYLKRKKEIRLDYVAALSGLVMVAQTKKIKRLYPALKTAKGWKAIPMQYGESPQAIELSMALMKRRIAQFVG